MNRFFEVALLLAFLISPAAIGGPLAGQDQSSACRFASTPPSGAPAIVAPDEVKSRVQWIAQSGSPVEIVSADLTGTRLMITEGPISRSYSFQPKAVFEVRNRSDRPITRIDIGVRAGSCVDSMTRPPNFMRPLRLPPGEVGRLEPVSLTLDARGVLNALPLKVWIWVERVDFGTCTYQPVQELPADLCATERRARGR